jgi:hypothetical protein
MVEDLRDVGIILAGDIAGLDKADQLAQRYGTSDMATRKSRSGAQKRKVSSLLPA